MRSCIFVENMNRHDNKGENIMNIQKHIRSYVVLCALLSAFPQIGAAQDSGSIEASATDNGGLPPGAVYENGVVLHPISSSEENLHLLAGYYYRNPREWKRIYKDNRKIIRNPNQLPVGETLRIQVGENWKPLFSYEEWFRLANRNGQWKAGQPWKPARAASGSGTITAPSTAVPATPQNAQAAPTSEPEATPVPDTPKEPETPPAQPQVAAPATPTETPQEEQPQPTPTEETSESGATDDEDAAPAF